PRACVPALCSFRYHQGSGLRPRTAKPARGDPRPRPLSADVEWATRRRARALGGDDVWRAAVLPSVGGRPCASAERYPRPETARGTPWLWLRGAHSAPHPLSCLSPLLSCEALPRGGGMEPGASSCPPRSHAPPAA